MSALTKVVVIGASGNLGSIILRSLLASPSIKVSVVTRLNSKTSFAPEVTVFRTGLTEVELVEVFKGQDAIISTVGAAGLAEQKTFVDAAVKAGVKRFIPSELSVNTLSERVRDLLPLFNIKLELLDYLKKMETTGLTWTGLAPGILFDWGLRLGILGFDLAQKTAAIWNGGTAQFSITNEADLGRAVLSILENPSATANKYLYIATVTTTQNDILVALETESGVKWSTTAVSTEVEVAKAREKLSTGDFSGALTLVQASAYGGIPGTRANYATEEQLANELLRLPDGSVEETVKDVLQS